MHRKGKNRSIKIYVKGNHAYDLLKFCIEEFPVLGSKTAVKKAIAEGNLLVNNKKAKANGKLRAGDLVELLKKKTKKVKSVDFDLDIIYQDDHLVVVNKPGGIAVNGNRNKTVENYFANTNHKNPQKDALTKITSTHRIDLPTCGLVLLAKTKSALIKLSRDFQEKKIQKEYKAIVHGTPPKKGVINRDIQGKKASTEFENIETVPSKMFGHLSLLKLTPITGRTHQLRIHLNDSGYLIVGDKLYAGKKRTIQGKGLLLCASKLSFIHPDSKKKMQFEIAPPRKFKKIMESEKRWSKNK